MKLWLDDKRYPLIDFCGPTDLWATTGEQALDMLIAYRGQIEAVSCDHDLGDGIEGYQIIRFLEDGAFDKIYPSLKISIHTANIPARDRMLAGAQQAHRYWGRTDSPEIVLADDILENIRRAYIHNRDTLESRYIEWYQKVKQDFELRSDVHLRF